MIPLAINKQVCTWLCVCPFAENTSIEKKLFFIIFTLILFVGNLCVIATSVVFVIKFVSIDLEGSLHALFQISAYTGIAYAIMASFMLRRKIGGIFDALTIIYTNNADTVSYRLLIQTNNTCQWMWKFYFKFMTVTATNTAALAALSFVGCQFKYGYIDEKYLYHPYKVVLPWNCETGIGYFGEILFHTVTGQGYIFLNGSLLLLFISMCLHHRAFYNMYQESLDKFKCIDTNENDRNNMKLLSELIEIHKSFKSWMLESANAYSPFVLGQLICLTICIACVIFELDLQIKHLSFDVSILLIAFLVSTANPFMYCYFGEMATNSYEKMAHGLFESNWQPLSVHLQKYFILMICNAQQPLYYHGFGIAVLDLQTFVTIFRKIISFFMMFKTLTSN